MPIDIPIKRLDEELPLPENAYAGDAAVDLRSTTDCVIGPHERMLVPTGVAIELPDGYAALVVPRSGLAIKHGISIVNAPGLIDSNYRGEIKAILMNADPHEEFHIQRGDRIAQLMIVPVAQPRFKAVDHLSDSERGEGGFGSSGVSA